MDVCFVAATHDLIINNIPEKEGQLIASIDSPEIFYDLGGNRKRIPGSSIKIVASLPEDTSTIDESILYALIKDDSEVEFYVYYDGNWHTDSREITSEQIDQWFDEL